MSDEGTTVTEDPPAVPETPVETPETAPSPPPEPAPAPEPRIPSDPAEPMSPAGLKDCISGFEFKGRSIDLCVAEVEELCLIGLKILEMVPAADARRYKQVATRAYGHVISRKRESLGSVYMKAKGF